MGYDTSYVGEFKINKPLNAYQIKHIENIFGEDCRTHLEWGATDLTYIDLELSKDKKRIIYDGSEKSYDMTEKLALVVKLMRAVVPDFQLDGEFVCQGEDYNDRYLIKTNSLGDFEKEDLAYVKIPESTPILCPHCGKDTNFGK